MKLSNIFRRTSIGWLPTAVLSGAALAIFSSPGSAQTVRRVAFSNGKPNAVFSDAAKIGEKDVFVVRLKKGQSCQIDVEWHGADAGDEGQGLSGYTIIAPNGKKSIDPQDGYLQAESAGDYKIIVSPKTRKTDYRYRIVFTRI